MKFEKGKSGNPKGRPKDTRTADMRELLRSQSDKLIGKAVKMALDGDPQALRLCLERILPPLRAKDGAVVIPGLTGAQTLTEKGQAVMDSAADGTITPTEAATFMQSLTGLARVIETDELEKRIEALEGGRHEP